MAAAKPADVRFPVHDLIAARWSPVVFDPRPVAPEAIGSLLEAARWAPSCYNGQPWRFLVARNGDPAAHARMLACLAAKNQAWARQAPVLMIAVAARHFTSNGRPNAYAEHDVGLAVMNLLLQATALGLHAHPMAGFDKDKVRQTYAVPEGFDPVTAIAVGRLGDPAQAAPEHRERDEAPRQRQPLGAMVFEDAWEQPPAWLER